MRAVIQRVSRARVSAEGEVVGAIGKGLLVLAAVESGDDDKDVAFLSKKILNLRLFSDAAGKMNLSVRDVGGSLLLVSQFTLFGDCRKGNRPSYSRASPGGEAEALYQTLLSSLRESEVAVEAGRFQAMMEVSLVNDGPVTVIVDSRREI